MNTKVYEKTRYQNIYRHKNNKNYIVMISKPVKTSISEINGNKILKLEDALKVRDNPKIKYQKSIEISNIKDFDTLYANYTDYCTNVRKMAKNSIIRKGKTYNKYLKGKFNKKISKITENDFNYYINTLKCTEKTKNEIIKEAKAFFNWCVKEKILLYNPIANVSKYKVLKSEMKYWTPEEIKKFFTTIQYDIDNNINKEIAYRTYIFTLIGFSLGDRTGETLNLTFDDFNYKTNTVTIKGTKTKKSDREIDVSPKLMQELKKYHWHLINEFDYDIIKSELIFCNHKTKQPLSDTTMRKHFYYYCDKAGVSKIRMYDLRHTYVATMMMEGKELYHISQRLGHSS
jgi:integrase